MKSNQLFSKNELVKMAEQVLPEKGPAVSAVMSLQQHCYVYNNFGRQKYDVDDEDYSEVMCLFLLFINEYIKTDGEII